MSGGRRPHRPTDEQRRQVMTLAGLGIPQTEIASLLRLAPKTLRLRYRHELNTGATEANIRVAQSLFNMATKGQVPSAAIFWLKARAGWREPPRGLNGDDQADTPTMITFEWAPARLAAPADAAAPLTIDADADAADADADGVVVSWAGEGGK